MEIEEQIAALAADSPADQMNDEEWTALSPASGKGSRRNDVDNSLFANNAFTVCGILFPTAAAPACRMDDDLERAERAHHKGAGRRGASAST